MSLRNSEIKGADGPYKLEIIHSVVTKAWSVLHFDGLK